MKLISNKNKVGPGRYYTEDGAYRISKATSYSDGLKRRWGNYIVWTAVSMTEKGEAGNPLVVAQGLNITHLKENLEKYLSDKANGIIQDASVYSVRTVLK